MISCPNCHKPVSGTARVCGYCGISIVQDYFSAEAKATEQYPSIRGGTVAAGILGVFAALAVSFAAGMQMVLMFRGETPAPDLLFWVRMVVMVFFAVLFLVQQCVLHGLRFSLLFDSFWLFASACGLGFVLQGFLEKGAAAFYGSAASAFLLLSGCALGVLSCATGIFFYRKPE